MIACFGITVSHGDSALFGLYLQHFRRAAGPMQDVEFEIAAAQGQFLSRFQLPKIRGA